MTPFVAGIAGFVIIGERMTNFEIIAMLISFVAIIVIATTRANNAQTEDSTEEEAKNYIFFGEDAKTATIVGCILLVIFAVANGLLSVLSRMLQEIDVIVIMNYCMGISILILLPALIIEN